MTALVERSVDGWNFVVLSFNQGTFVRQCYGRNLDGLRGNGISENAEHGLANCISVASIKFVKVLYIRIMNLGIRYFLPNQVFIKYFIVALDFQVKTQQNR